MREGKLFNANIVAPKTGSTKTFVSALSYLIYKSAIKYTICLRKYRRKVYVSDFIHRFSTPAVIKCTLRLSIE